MLSAPSVSAITPRSPAPSSSPKAMPSLRTFDSLNPKISSTGPPSRDVPDGDLLGRLVERDHDSRRRQRPRPGAPRIHGAFYAPDQADDDRARDEQHDGRDDRAQVEREAAASDRRQYAAEEVEVRVRDVVDEADHRAQRRVVRDARDPAQQDPHEDQDQVDEEQRVDVVRDLVPADGGEHEGHLAALAFSTTASTAAPNAARTLYSSSFATPAAVTPPGEVTARRSDTASRCAQQLRGAGHRGQGELRRPGARRGPP